MPIIKSAKKRVKVTASKSVQNARTKKGLRATLKAFQTALTSGKKVDEAQVAAQSAIDTAVKKGIISKNKAARKKSQLNSAAKKVSGGKKTTVAKKVAKPAAKPVAKEVAPAKKAVAKKAPAKKPAAKK
jgi:small subunit ribosomal protein S20